jgi:hypothetical protein
MFIYNTLIATKNWKNSCSKTVIATNSIISFKVNKIIYLIWS